MRLFSAEAALLGLAAMAHVPAAFAKPYPVHMQELRDEHNASQMQRRAPCGNGGTTCGYYSQLCCNAGQVCGEDSLKQAICVDAAQGGGVWKTYTTTWVETLGLKTYTSVYSSYVGGAAPNAQPTGTCKDSQSPCGSLCCDSGYYCITSGQCALIGGGSTGGILPSAPLRPTSSGVVIVTYTGQPTATVPFQTPIPTGVNGPPVPVEDGTGGGLSGGAIAGIVIGVILGVILLLLLCLFCCARALFDTIAAIFGFGKKRKHTHEETYIEEHRHSAGGGGAAGGRHWYGNRPSRPSRVGSEKKSGIGKGMGMAAALGGLALALGLKRKHDQKHDDKSTTISGSSYYYSDYTSSSSASSDRRTRNTRHSSRR